MVYQAVAALWENEGDLLAGGPFWRGYTEKILIVSLAFAMAIAYLTKARRWPPASWALDTVSLGIGGWLVVRFPTLSANVFHHPTEALIFSAIGVALIIEAVRRTMGWSLIVILSCVCLYSLFASELNRPAIAG